MKIRNLKRDAAWLVPGLFIKRWIGIGAFGLLLIIFGLTLVMNLQPVSFVIEVLKTLARYFPSPVSGPIIVIVGGFLFYLGAKRLSGNIVSAMEVEGSDARILEAVFRRRKLLSGPRVVAIGGGTGLSTLLRGLKHYTANITAVVTVGDDGGSSGRLRQEQGIIPPGDIRNCIAALADEEKLITELFQYRFKTGQGLEGHSFGNLFLTAMAQVTGDMMSAIKESSKVLSIRGQVLPATLESIKLIATMEDGRVIEGESNIPEAQGKIAKLTCEPMNPKPLPDVLKAIEDAEMIIMGPGSLYTSIIPNLLIQEIAQAVAAKKVPKVYVANVMTQPGETDGFTLSEHIKAILMHSGQEHLINSVIVSHDLPQDLLDKYQVAGYEPVPLDEAVCQSMGIELVRGKLIDEKEPKLIRHNPRRLAKTIMDWYRHLPQKKNLIQFNNRFYSSKSPKPDTLSAVVETKPQPEEVTL